MEAKLFILVRNDIPLPNQCVQACHVTERWTYLNETHDNSSGGEGYGTTVVLSVPDAIILSQWMRKMLQKSIDYEMFREPNLGNEVTAIACLTDTNIFSDLPMWPVKEKDVYIGEPF